MNKLKMFFVAALAVASVSAAAQAEGGYGINHGPYLQGLTSNAVVVSFTTSEKGFSKVELRRAGDSEVRICDSRKDGLIMADNTSNAIRIENLKPATEYEYRIVSTQVVDFQPYKVTFGQTIHSDWYSFRTVDPKARSFEFVVMNDLHDTPAKCDKLLSMQPLEDVDMVFYVGDIMSYFSHPEQPYESFIDVSTERFAKHKPFAVVRGNHETRGALARSYADYIHNNAEGRYYGLYCFGDTAVVMLDCGEDKEDNHEVYAGFTAFDEYRLQQVEWLKQVVKSKAFRSARHRIVMLHIPPATEAMTEQNPEAIKEMLTWHGNVHWGQILLPVLNKAGIDLMISAHEHRYVMLPQLKGVHNFPIVVNDDKSAMLVRSDKDGISVKITSVDGRELLNTVF